MFVCRMDFNKTRWYCSWNSDQNCTQNSARVTFVCLKLNLCSYFQSDLFQIYTSRSSAYLHLCFWCQCCQLSRILGQSEVSKNKLFWPLDRQVANTLAALFTKGEIVTFGTETRRTRTFPSWYRWAEPVSPFHPVRLRTESFSSPRGASIRFLFHCN